MHFIIRADDVSFRMLLHWTICQLSAFSTKHDDFDVIEDTETLESKGF